MIHTSGRARSNTTAALTQAPRDKLVCILNCCRVINNLLHVGHDGDARGAPLPACVHGPVLRPFV